MVNREIRDSVLNLIAQVESGKITNYEFLEALCEFTRLSNKSQHKDLAFGDLLDFCNACFNGWDELKLIDEFAIQGDVKVIIERWKLFLKSNLEFECPLPKDGCLLSIIKSVTYMYLSVFLSEEKLNRIFQIKEFHEIAPQYDMNVWPFKTQQDYEKIKNSSKQNKPKIEAILKRENLINGDRPR